MVQNNNISIPTGAKKAQKGKVDNTLTMTIPQPKEKEGAKKAKQSKRQTSKIVNTGCQEDDF
jgi:hypothetical protein